ncbi:MAG TPA: START-like domain-containing protein [Chitinophagales bacterium]|nr:START-like domain-containing protein [Chitinophagales bacterium]
MASKSGKQKGAASSPSPQPVVQEQKPKGSPTQLSMALEEKETKPVFIRPRITRSKSGNLSFQLEYTIRSSPAILYEFLTTPSGLAQWFADSVDITDHHCRFVWEGVEEYATIIDSIPDEYIRYRWDNSDEDEYFEFRITKNEITGDTILTITDFASESELNDQKMLWDSQVKTLIQQIGG